MKKLTAILAITLSLIFTVPLIACGEAESGSAPALDDPKKETIPDVPSSPDSPPGEAGHDNLETEEKQEDPKEDHKAEEQYDVELGKQIYRRFLLDCVYHAKDEGDIHFNVYFPKSYDGSHALALYFTLPKSQMSRAEADFLPKTRK